MRITLRLTVSLILVVTVVASGFAYLQVRQEKERQEGELEHRSRLLAESLQETIEPLLAQGPSQRLQRLVERFGNRKRLAGVAVYDLEGAAIAMTTSVARSRPTTPRVVMESLERNDDAGAFESVAGKPVHVYAFPLHEDERMAAALAIFHDTSYIQAHLSRIWRETFLRLLVQMILISMVTLFIVRWSIINPIAQVARWMRRSRMGGEAESLRLIEHGLFQPIAHEAAQFTKSLSAARAAAEEEARLRGAADSLWTPERLKEHISTTLQGKTLLVISNREPYMHVQQGSRVECIMPASGMVTAIEPILRACGGTWIAHGAGDADRKVVDDRDRVKAPPEDPRYTLRRVWLTKEEEEGYYYGFANEGLWPLCHIAHTRPIFRSADWAQYQAVNHKFADAALRELEGSDAPFVLIQDYHFALLPRMIKAQRPDARVAIFWHIPWPNPEAFGICPWQRDLLVGMLGADLIGFHIQYHCNNFLDTVDRALESRIDREHFTVTHAGQTSWIRPVPISIAFTNTPPAALNDDAQQFFKEQIVKDVGVHAEFLGVGVDRLDYTKGLLERFRAIERFFEKYPTYLGRFTFAELGAPSRSHITRYYEYTTEVEAEVNRINWRFQTAGWKPVVFLKKHHSHEEIEPFYRAADLCLVTSLHDGMNLVAKEFVAARDDLRGVLILSCFTGAARELRDALIVNPYDIDQMADAIGYALTTKPEEQAARMDKMRQAVGENNVYRWAARITSELASIRLAHEELRAPFPQ